MIVKEFNINEINLKYFVGINQIRINLNYLSNICSTSSEKELLDSFFRTIENVQNRFKNSVIQFIKDKYVLNQDHIFTACYYFQKAFFYKSNISNKQKIELLLYLATNRQISKSIHTSGINSDDIRKGKLLFCIISPINNLKSINEELLQILKANETKLTVNVQSSEKFNLIREYFEISENQISCILNSYGVDSNSPNNNLDSKFSAIYDLICEKMALLNLEKQ